MAQHLMNNYGRLPVTFEKGQGVWLWDSQGNQYLDALSGIAVNGLGHAHPKFVAAIQAQTEKLIHVSNLYHITEQTKLADKLAEVSGMDKTFFCNSGCEANEAMIKLARLYGHEKGVEDPEILVMEKAFHGRTMATLSATGNRKAQAGFEPLVKGFIRVPFDDLEAIKQVAARKNNVVAIMLEPVQGEGGIQMPADSKAYLQGLRDICDAEGWLLMLDEVQSGIGRTGHWFAFQHTAVTPDVMSLAKGLGSGVPIGACIAKGAAADVFTPGRHGSTFGGGPLATAAGSATLDIIEQEKLQENATTIGNYITQSLKEAFKDQPGVVSIRHAGLMIGMQLYKPCGELVQKALDKQLLINVTDNDVIRLLPPLVMNKEEAQLVIERLVPLVNSFLKGA